MEEIRSLLDYLKSNVVELLTEEELKNLLIQAQANKEPLRIKLGIDVTGAAIHLGFAVVLRKLRQFQELGHIGVLIIGDFTARIGDPSGRSKTRPQLTVEEIEKNMREYKKQVFKILLPEMTEFRYNSEWHKKLDAEEIIKITSRYTVARLLERDDFSRRYQEGLPIYLHEFLYPLFQAYDSIAVKADVELGGSDQYWNLLVGRELMREFNLKPQVVMTLPLLTGLDGKLKMSKSYGNYISITEEPKEMFGKIMSIPDDLIIQYFRLATNRGEDEITLFEERLRKGENPRNLKALLASDIVSIYHSTQAAQEAEEEFERVFKYKKLPTKIPEYQMKISKIRLIDLLLETELLPSRSEAKRKIAEGSIYIDGERVKDVNFDLTIDKERVLKVGKRRFLKLLPPR